MSHIDNTFRVELYRQLYRIRRAEELLAEHYPAQQMRCPMHLSIGQEAVAVGVCSALKQDDVVFSGHRAHAHYLAKGGDLKALYAELYGKQDGCCGGRGGSMHLIDTDAGFLGATPIVAGTVPIAVGTAFANKLQDLDTVSVIFIGDGAFEEGVVHEAMNFSASKQLPIIFVCENNNYSVYTKLSERQPDRPIHKIAAAHGLHTRNSDGNDVETVFTVATEAVDAIRHRDSGPWFLEFETHRWREHCGPYEDDDLGYRESGELEHWKDRCPVAGFSQHLLQAGALSEQGLQQLHDAIELEITDALQFAWDSPQPDPLTCAEHLYE